MHAISANDRSSQRGFTLIEVLVIAPIVILVLGVLVAAIVSLTGSTLVAQGRNATSASIHTALVDIERDIKASSAFFQTTGALASPQGSNDDTAAFTTIDGDTLIIKTPLTSANPLNDSRILVSYANRPYTCDSPTASVNELIYVTTIYFVRDGSLWRRTVLPEWTASSGDINSVCISPWRKNSCAPSISGTRCQATDTRLIDSIAEDGFTVTYYTTAGGDTEATGANINHARSAKVSITSSPSYSGNTLRISGELRFALP